jgi:hypothetical protein
MMFPCDLERGSHSLRFRVGTEDMVEIARRRRGQARCELERAYPAHVLSAVCGAVRVVERNYPVFY